MQQRICLPVNRSIGNGKFELFGFVLDSEYRGIYQGAINGAATSGKYDLLSATTPVDESIGLVTTYYP